MASKLFVFAVIACLAVAQGAKLSNPENTELITANKESRILAIPTIGDLVFAGLKSVWLLMSTAWSVAGYKLAAIALVANIGVWVVRNCLSALVGAGITLAFCKLTGMCSTDYEYVEVSDELVLAAKHLEDGVAKYSSN